MDMFLKYTTGILSRNNNGFQFGVFPYYQWFRIDQGSCIRLTSVCRIVDRAVTDSGKGNLKRILQRVCPEVLGYLKNMFRISIMRFVIYSYQTIQTIHKSVEIVLFRISPA